MTDTLDNTAGQAEKRPTFLTVLCILSFIAAGIGIISLLLVGAAKGVVDASGAGSEIGDAMASATRAGDAGAEALSAVEAVFSWPYILTSVAIVLVGLFGVIKMWKLQKQGFYIYTVTQVAGLILPVVFGMAFPVMGTVMALAFIVMYGVNLKAMK